MSVEEHKAWEKKIENLVNKLLEKDNLLRQYAIWLETSEQHTKHKGEDIYHRLEGVLQTLSSVDFIPGIGWGNFITVIQRVQEKTGLDLGVCKFLDYTHGKFNTRSKCEASGYLLIGGLKTCLPPDRNYCGKRATKLKELISKQ